MTEEQEYDLKKYKTIIIGKTTVGKSTLLRRYVDGEFNPQKPTIGIDYRFKKVKHQQSTFDLELWDSAGQERYRNIVYNYFTLSKAAVIVFDLTNQESLDEAKNWLQQLVNHCGNDIPKILLGNKHDLLTSTQLEQNLERYKARIEELQQDYHCEFFMVSAKSGLNLNQAFNFLAAKIYNRYRAIEADAQKQLARVRLKSNSQHESKIQQVKKDSCC